MTDRLGGLLGRDTAHEGDASRANLHHIGLRSIHIGLCQCDLVIAQVVHDVRRAEKCITKQVDTRKRLNAEAADVVEGQIWKREPDAHVPPDIVEYYLVYRDPYQGPVGTAQLKVDSRVLSG